MTRGFFMAGALALSLVGCAGTTAMAVTATVSAAQARLQAAITLYGISKGIAQVGAIADPGLAPVLAIVTSALDPVVARARQSLTTATLDAAALEKLAATISAQANALTLAAAPVIKVVPSA